MRDENAYLSDILSACEVITEYVGGHTFDSFSNSRMLRDAVYYELMVVGEATRYLSEETKINVPEIPWPAIRRTRNVLVHDYLNVDQKIIWITATKHIPELAVAVKSLMSKGD